MGKEMGRVSIKSRTNKKFNTNFKTPILSNLGSEIIFNKIYEVGRALVKSRSDFFFKSNVNISSFKK